MTALDDVLTKIAKLLALAENNANENEAAAAMAAASRLMEQHKIDRAEVDGHSAEPEPIDTEVGQATLDDDFKKMSTWKAALAAGIAQANGCKSFVQRYRPVRRPGQRRAVAPSPTIEILGASLDVAATRYLYAYACRQIDAFAVEALRAAEHPGRTWANNFRVACTDRVVERYRAASSRNRDEMRGAASGAALARLTSADDEIRRNLERFLANMKLRTVSQSYRADEEAAAAGRAAGDLVDLGTGAPRAAIGAGAASLKSGV